MLRQRSGQEKKAVMTLRMITAYDRIGYGNSGYLAAKNPRLCTAEDVAAMVQEYSDFTLYLYEAYKNTHKRFILSN